MFTSTSTGRDASLNAICAPGRAGRWVLGVLASLLLLSVTMSPATAASPPDGAALARMDGVISDGMDGSGVPGFAVAVVSGNDLVHARGFGDAGDGRRATAQTPFLLGSTSKSFTALAAMQLVDAGRLDLGAPARRYVPSSSLPTRGPPIASRCARRFSKPPGCPRRRAVRSSGARSTAPRLRPCTSCRTQS